MTRANRITRIEFLPSFQKDWKRLDPQTLSDAKAAIQDLLKDPIPASRRVEKLGGFRNPDIYTIHVTSNHSYKLSYEISGDVALLRRVSTHKTIDRTP